MYLLIKKKEMESFVSVNEYFSENHFFVETAHLDLLFDTCTCTYMYLHVHVP